MTPPKAKTAPTPASTLGHLRCWPKSFHTVPPAMKYESKDVLLDDDNLKTFIVDRAVAKWRRTAQDQERGACGAPYLEEIAACGLNSLACARRIPASAVTGPRRTRWPAGNRTAPTR